MSAGFEVVNDDGIVVVDETYICLGLRASGTAVADTGFGFSDGSSNFLCKDITYTGGSFPLMVIYKPQQGTRTDVGAGILGCKFNGNGSWTWRIGVMGNQGYRAVDYSFSYYIFDIALPKSSGNAGIEVYNASSQLVFSSSYRPMRVCDPSLTSYPNGKYGHGYDMYVNLSTDSYETTNSHGGIDYQERWRFDATAWYSTPTGISSAGFNGGGQGSAQYQPQGIESGGGGNSTIVNLAGL